MRTVLIVDDDADFAGATQAVLQAHGYDVLTAENGESGYSAAKERQPDLMLLDVMMAHDTEGFDLVQRIRGDSALAHVPIIMITGIRRARNIPFGFEPDDEWLPVSAVLEKPVAPETLLRHVDDILAAKTSNGNS